MDALKTYEEVEVEEISLDDFLKYDPPRDNNVGTVDDADAAFDGGAMHSNTGNSR